MKCKDEKEDFEKGILIREVEKAKEDYKRKQQDLGKSI